MPSRHTPAGSTASSARAAERLERGIGFGDDPVEQRQQHRVLRREVEVERRAGDPGTLGEVIDGDLGERSVLQQLLQPSREWPAHGRRRTGGRRGDRGRRAAGWQWSRRKTLQPCRIFQHTVDSLDTVLITLHHDRICRRRHRRSRDLRHQRRLAPAGPLPDKSYVVLERRDNLGGTWDLFNYPGIRSDSDMFTLGFRFKPWTSEKAIADGPSIMSYLKETVAEYGIDKHIRYGQKVVGADWSDAENRWTLRVDRGGEEVEIKASFLFACSGYYNYDQGYSPEFAGSEDFEGTIIHPQHWPEELDYAGKKIVVIGSGATAVTLIPALANSGAGHVTMLQRSPSYIVSLPDVDPSPCGRTRRCRREGLRHGYPVEERPVQQSIALPGQPTVAELHAQDADDAWPSASYPRATTSTSTSPRYNPWDQRLCLAPNGDLFKTIREWQGRHRHRHHRAVHQDRYQADLRRGAACRHHRHRNGFEPSAVRWCRDLTQRRAGRPATTRWPSRA